MGNFATKNVNNAFLGRKKWVLSEKFIWFDKVQVVRDTALKNNMIQNLTIKFTFLKFAYFQSLYFIQKRESIRGTKHMKSLIEQNKLYMI